MNRKEQGVRNQNRLDCRFVIALWLAILCFSQTLYAGTGTTDNNPSSTSSGDNHAHHYITLLYSANSTLYAEIAQNITRSFAHNDKNIVITDISTSDINNVKNSKPELLIAIGLDSIESANSNFYDTSKLLIASNPGEYRPVNGTEDKNTVLYMSQPYCRQIHFIKLLNRQWHAFSYLSSQNNPVDDDSLQQCAGKLRIAAYKVVTSDDVQLTHYIKDALSHSDLILALPDKAIYNSKSVKNILLTSYRDRKPIIGFSRSFVNAGALAAIHSDTEQIAHSASVLVNQFLEMGDQFSKPVNYPRTFDVSINRQVFRALDLSIPDIAKIKRILEKSESEKTGSRQ